MTKEETEETKREVSPLDTLNDVVFGEMQTYKNVSAVPLFHSNMGPLVYGTLADALRDESLVVSEVSEGGSVPDLKVINNSEIPVLILSGEELKGGKQNRVLNTSMLVAAKSEIVVPVTCTEAGRWHYSGGYSGGSGAMYGSGYTVPSNARASGAMYCSSSLNASGTYRGNQSDSWERFSRYASRTGTHTQTGAMEDVYAAKENDIREFLEALKRVPDQKGVLVFVNGKVAGFDLLSRAEAYETLHEKLIKSYVMDALVDASPRTEANLEDAHAFIDKAQACGQKKYKSTGLGWDYRFDGPAVVGLSLVHDDTTVHTAFFKKQIETSGGFTAGNGYTTRMVSFNQRARM